jgi:hypothetical protein
LVGLFLLGIPGPDLQTSSLEPQQNVECRISNVDWGDSRELCRSFVVSPSLPVRKLTDLPHGGERCEFCDLPTPRFQPDFTSGQLPEKISVRAPAFDFRHSTFEIPKAQGLRLKASGPPFDIRESTFDIPGLPQGQLTLPGVSQDPQPGFNRLDPSAEQMVFFGDPKLPTTHLMYAVHLNRLDPPKYSPKKFGDTDPLPFEFDWEVDGYCKRVPEATRMDLLFRVFSQERKEKNDKGVAASDMLVHLWDLGYKKFKVDHLPLYGNEVDVYLCWGGTPGGEQRMDVDLTEQKPPRERKVNTIYIYDLASFTNPIEMAREVAHEYGHAVLAAVGGFKTPEDWGNGQLGEKLFLTWCRAEMQAGRMGPNDVMGATLPMVDAWVKKNVDPLILDNALNGPSFELLGDTGQASMDAFTGLVCYADAFFPDDLVGMSLRLMTTDRAKDYPAALLLACQNKKRVVVSIPDIAKGKDFWVPLGNGTVNGGDIVKRNGDWALVHPAGVFLTLLY